MTKAGVYVAALEAELADCWTTHDVGYSDAEAIEIAAEELGKDQSGLVVVREGSTISVMTIGAADSRRAELTNTFRAAFASHPARHSDPALALESARETVCNEAAPGEEFSFDDDELTVS